MPVPTAASPPGILPIKRVWLRSIDIAQEKLREKKLPPLDLSDPTLKTVGITVGDLKSKGVSGGRFRKVLKTIDNYAKIVDTAIQHHPEITALVWAGVKVILQVGLHFLSVLIRFSLL